MEIHNGLPKFDCLKAREPIKNYITATKCNNPEHEEYGAEYVEYDDGTIKQITFCPKCEKEKLEQEQKRLEKEIREENIQHCKKCNVEPEYYNKTFDDYIPQNESQELALQAAKDLLEGKIKKLVLLGKYGTGKTMLGSILAKESDGRIYTMYEISTMIRQSYTVKADKTELEIVSELASIPGILVIDEVGRVTGSSFNNNWQSYVLDKRHTRGLKIVYIGNGHLRENCPNHGCDKCFENSMDGDVISRLRQDSKIINILGSDYRAKK